jgi:putative photosynthetic complex assembly protein 2
MIEQGVSFVFTVLLWWLSTGLFILLCTRSPKTFPYSLAAGSLVVAVALYGLRQSAQMTSESGAYIAFLSAIGVWGWIEMSFLMGYVTGPRTSPCPTDATGWRRFRLALDALIYHELAILTAALAIVALTWDAPNQTGTYAFLILFAMRVSAKLNIFLGVPNLSDEYLPARLTYLRSYFRKRRFNALMPASIAAAGLVAYGLAGTAASAESGAATGAALLFTLLSLAILEHIFMILPLPDSALWQWAMPGAIPVNVAKPAEKPLP